MERRSFIIQTVILILFLTPAYADISNISTDINEILNFDYMRAKIVVGASTPAPAMDGVSASIVAGRIGTMTFEEEKAGFKVVLSRLTYLDSEVNNKTKKWYNLILIGGPVANSISKEVFDKMEIKITNDNPGPEVGVVQLIKDPFGYGKDVLVIAGSDRDGTLEASKFWIDMWKIV